MDGRFRICSSSSNLLRGTRGEMKINVECEKNVSLQKKVGMEINAQFLPHLANVVNILALHKVKNAYLFGSVLTDRFNPSSDVDFLVNYDPSMDPLERGELLLDLQIALEDEIHRDVDLLTEYSLKNPYFINELNETKYLIYGEAN